MCEAWCGHAVRVGHCGVQEALHRVIRSMLPVRPPDSPGATDADSVVGSKTPRREARGDDSDSSIGNRYGRPSPVALVPRPVCMRVAAVATRAVIAALTRVCPKI